MRIAPSSLVALALAVGVALVGACDKAAPTEASPPAETPSAGGPPPIAPRAEGPLGEVLDTYDDLQKRLAKDDASGVAAFDKLAIAAKAAAATSGPTQAPLNELAAAAAKLSGKTDASLADQRAAFAEVSKAFVGVLVADPSLQTGRFIFECPMAPAYRKWVQTHPTLQNPYWGSQMLECGGEAKWSV